jgi:NADH:ubiquinone oxidoreductase subunit E
VLTITVCVGSSCFVRGAPRIIEEFQALLQTLPAGAVDLRGSFCMEKCTDGVTVRIGEKIFTGVTPEAVPGLFEEHVRGEARHCQS